MLLSSNLALDVLSDAVNGSEHFTRLRGLLCLDLNHHVMQVLDQDLLGSRIESLAWLSLVRHVSGLLNLDRPITDLARHIALLAFVLEDSVRFPFLRRRLEPRFDSATLNIARREWLGGQGWLPRLLESGVEWSSRVEGPRIKGDRCSSRLACAL